MPVVQRKLPLPIIMIDKFTDPCIGRIYGYPNAGWDDMRMVANPMPQATQQGGAYLSGSEVSSMGPTVHVRKPCQVRA